MTRTLVVCPGRGSYSRDTLGSLRELGPEATAIVDACDAFRAQHSRPTVRELDAAERFQARLHVAGEHASLLTFAVGLVDASQLDPSQHEVVGVTGNSMGWYTALAVAGALSLEHAIELVDTMGAYQARNIIGGQVMMPVTGPDWSDDPALRADVHEAIEAVRAEGSVVETSIDLGSFVVLGADSPGVKRLLERLPTVERGSRTFPVQLPLHSAFHTSLMAPTSQRAFEDLSHLEFRGPRMPLFDGRGVVHRPFSADPDALRHYTLGPQVNETYDFATALRSALRHCAPEVVVVLGPGNSLGGPIAYGLLDEGWAAVRERQELAQRGLIRSFGVPEQRRLVVG